MQNTTEELYDHFSPLYWVKFGLYANETHLAYLRRFINMVPPQSSILSAACGAGRYDGFLLEAGHSVVGIDQSAGMLARARKHFPQVRYKKKSLQEMDFQIMFHGAICMDVMEHVCPEDWPGILRNFHAALKPGGVLYFTVDVSADTEELTAAYEQAKTMGLPVVLGELVDKVGSAGCQVKATDNTALAGETADQAVYHYYPPLTQVRTWLKQANFTVDHIPTPSTTAIKS